MLAIAKIADETKFRKDMFKAKRKPIEKIWVGEQIQGVTDIARFAPSACNTQPWIVEHTENKLYVYRYKKPGKRGIMPADKVSFYNQIDIGIHGYSDWATTVIDADVKSMWYRLSRREDDYRIESSKDGVHFEQMRVCHLHKGDGKIQFGIYACSPENSSFKADFSNMEMMECQWKAHN